MRPRIAVPGLGAALALLLGSAAAPPLEAQPARVLAVLDGATLRAHIYGQEQAVRLIGLRSLRDVSCIEAELVAFTQGLRPDVRLQEDPALPFRVGRLLVRYASQAGTDLSAEILRRGLAFAVEGGYARRDLYARLQAEARWVGRGIWAPACAASREAERDGLPRGDVAAAREAIAALHERNVAGLNRSDEQPLPPGHDPGASEAAGEGKGAKRAPKGEAGAAAGRARQGREPRPGIARGVGSPVVRGKGDSVTVEGRITNPGETPARGKLKIELVQDGLVVDWTSVPLEIAPGMTQQYSVAMTPSLALGAAAPVAQVAWEPEE
ncbi:MAG TPA: hypothetical protein VMT16_09325 [Thermoanaerobaculia bacterium]|nr:hypothetical protein [Thermoanaerobaculia bacterium]